MPARNKPTKSSAEETKVDGTKKAPEKRSESDVANSRARLAVLLVAALAAAGCPPRYKDFEMTEDAGAETQTKMDTQTAPDKALSRIALPDAGNLVPKENPAKKYLGAYEISLKKHYFQVTFSKIKADEPNPYATRLINGVNAKLIMEPRITVRYHINLPFPLRDKRGVISQTGKVYDANGQHFIIFFVRDLKQNVVLKIREKNNRIQIIAPSSNNPKKVDDLFDGWANLTKLSY